MLLQLKKTTQRHIHKHSASIIKWLITENWNNLSAIYCWHSCEHESRLIRTHTNTPKHTHAHTHTEAQRERENDVFLFFCFHPLIFLLFYSDSSRILSEVVFEDFGSVPCSLVLVLLIFFFLNVNLMLMLVCDSFTAWLGANSHWPCFDSGTVNDMWEAPSCPLLGSTWSGGHI